MGISNHAVTLKEKKNYILHVTGWRTGQQCEFRLFQSALRPLSDGSFFSCWLMSALSLVNIFIVDAVQKRKIIWANNYAAMEIIGWPVAIQSH